MIAQAVDLASSLSACVVLSEDAVMCQDDSVFMSQAEWVRAVCQMAVQTDPDVIAVEDLPHSLKFASLVKSVCRLQGRLIAALEERGLADRVLFVPPACWQRHFDGVWRQGKDGSHAKAVELGYTPPPMLERYAEQLAALTGAPRSALRSKLVKALTDYEDAFLIARWALDVRRDKGTFDVPSTQRVV